MNSGAQSITDATELAAVQRQARHVQWQSLIAAALMTALYLFLS